MKISVRKLVLAAMFLALCMVLPFLTGQVPEIGSMLLPMHLPVLIAGFVLGAPYGALIGFIAPFLRFFIFREETKYTHKYLKLKNITEQKYKKPFN